MRRGARGARREGLRRGGEVRGDEARGARGEASGLKVERCTLNVGRQRAGVHRHVRPHWRMRPRRGTPPDLKGLGRGARRGRMRREARGERREGMRQEG
jgi:hypothetical protein